MPSSVVYLKLWSMKASSRVEADSSVGEMEPEEPQVFCILLRTNRSDAIRAGDCSCRNIHCQPKTLYMCQIVRHKELINDSLRWFFWDTDGSPNPREKNGQMRVEDREQGRWFMLFINLSDCIVELKDVSHLSPDEQKPNEHNTVWRCDQSLNSTVAFYFRIASGGNMDYYFLTYDGNGKKIVLQKGTSGDIVKSSIWFIEGRSP